MIKYTKDKHAPHYIVDNHTIYIGISCKSNNDYSYLVENTEEVYQDLERIVEKHLKENIRDLSLGIWMYTFYLDYKILIFASENLTINHLNKK